MNLPLTKYLSEVTVELRKVTWPDRQQTIQKTTLVIVVSLVVGVYIGALDFLFTRLATLLIK
jgi:preprotein translocase subunit SecE